MLAQLLTLSWCIFHTQTQSLVQADCCPEEVTEPCFEWLVIWFHLVRQSLAPPLEVDTPRLRWLPVSPLAKVACVPILVSFREKYLSPLSPEHHRHFGHP
jgi:hypothetical protein